MAYIAFTVIMAASAIIVFTVKQKECAPQQSLSWWVVCSDCEVDGCIDCFDSGEKYCDTCELGYYYSSLMNACLDCDSYENATTCAECTGRD